MTPTDHNKVIGIMHLIYGGFFLLVTIFMGVFFGLFAALMSSMPQEPGAPPPWFFGAFFGIFVVIYAILSIPSLLAGYAMLKRKSWARIAGIVASILAGLSFPFGTALCVYALWFFFGEQGRAFEQQMAAGGYGADARGSLGQGSPYGWEAQAGARREEEQHSYRPPTQPPDWRG